jgi:hypothetical protein
MFAFNTILIVPFQPTGTADNDIKGSISNKATLDHAGPQFVVLL